MVCGTTYYLKKTKNKTIFSNSQFTTDMDRTNEEDCVFYGMKYYNSVESKDKEYYDNSSG